MKAGSIAKISAASFPTRRGHARRGALGESPLRPAYHPQNSNGARAVDVCCGTGASAIPAAERLGPGGFVLGVDLVDKLLEHARSKARRGEGLKNIELRSGDMLALGLRFTAG